MSDIDRCLQRYVNWYALLIFFTVGQWKRSAEYNDLTREVQNALRKDKHEWLEEKCTEVEEMNRRHNTSGVYKTIKEITGKRGMRQMGIKDKDGKMVNKFWIDGRRIPRTCTVNLKSIG